MKMDLAEYQRMWDEIFVLQCEEVSLKVDNKKKINRLIRKLQRNSHKLTFDGLDPGIRR